LYLLDTNVVSELRRAKPHGAVTAWLGAVPPGALYISAVTLGELQAGVEITRGRDPGRAAEIEAWVDSVAGTCSVLPIDGRTFRTWAKLTCGRPKDLLQDALIAATALVHGLAVVTRNVRDFEAFRIPLVDPFAGPGPH
jgi:toxin FitB